MARRPGASRTTPAPVRRGLALGCGGTLGFAWSAVALGAVEAALGWDARHAELLLGTSAGSELAAILGSGRSTAAVIAALEGHPDVDPVLAAHLRHRAGMVPPLPSLGRAGTGLLRAGLRRRQPYTAVAGLLPVGRGDAGWLRTLGDRLGAATDGAWTEHPATWIVGADAASGERTAFGSPGAPPARLGEAIAASWAIPGWFPPVRIGDRRYVDGGSVSSVSADLLAPLDLDEVVVISPMTSAGGAPARGVEHLERVLRREMTRGLDAEIALLEAAGTRVVRIEPGPDDLAAMGANFMDARRRERTLRVAERTAPGRVAAALAAAGVTAITPTPEEVLR